MQLNLFDASALKGKRVLLRVDCNVPLDNSGHVSDDTRIRAHIPTIQALLLEGAQIALASHLGRPKGKIVPKYSLKPLIAPLENLLQKKILFCETCLGEKVEEAMQKRSGDEVVLLENLRFHPGEEANDPSFAKALAAPFDVFVMDAFSASHRAHASTEGITAFLPSYAGFLLAREADFLSQVRDHPKKPFLLILGGAKVSDKIGVIENLLEKVDTILIGGGMAFTFFAAQGFPVGASLCERDKISFVQEMMLKAREKGVEIILPRDILAGTTPEAKSKEMLSPESIPDHLMGLDIGPETAKEFASKISQASTVLWNGPMGVFENPLFAEGTKAVALALAEVTSKRGATTVVGGGDSASAINAFHLAQEVTHVSTGGGASLEFFEGKILPGIAPFMKTETI
ncbi:MAG TPA: phosphoglycerate kinase [Synergistaceae bacterium]|nr:phosphoglycerate kinase [Synergistaceae bacterium]